MGNLFGESICMQIIFHSHCNKLDTLPELQTLETNNLQSVLLSKTNVIILFFFIVLFSFQSQLYKPGLALNPKNIPNNLKHHSNYRVTTQVFFYSELRVLMVSLKRYSFLWYKRLLIPMDSIVYSFQYSKGNLTTKS